MKFAQIKKLEERPIFTATGVTYTTDKLIMVISLLEDMKHNLTIYASLLNNYWRVGGGS